MNEWVVGIVSGVLSGIIVGASFYIFAGRDLRRTREEILRASQTALEAVPHVLEDLTVAPRAGEDAVETETRRGTAGKPVQRSARIVSASTVERPVQKVDTGGNRTEVAERSSGVVKKYLARKGFGFISRPNEPDLFFHRSEVAEPDPLSRGDQVEFAAEETEPGKWRATNIVRKKNIA